MKLSMISILLCGVLGTQAIASQPAPQPPSKENVSYALGALMGKNFVLQNLDIDFNSFVQGVKDAYTGAKLRMSNQEIRDTMMAFQKYMMTKRINDLQTSKLKNDKESDAFFAKNTKQPGVISLADGLQYKVITAGNGPQPSNDADTVTFNYSGTSLDGKEFDSSYKRGTPATAQLQSLIPGWKEALKLMKAGSTWEVYLPAKLAYGAQGVPPVIGPDQALVFKVNLIEVKKSKPQ